MDRLQFSTENYLSKESNIDRELNVGPLELDDPIDREDNEIQDEIDKIKGYGSLDDPPIDDNYIEK